VPKPVALLAAQANALLALHSPNLDVRDKPSKNKLGVSMSKLTEIFYS
jgi:hypothetical protein